MILKNLTFKDPKKIVSIKGLDNKLGFLKIIDLSGSGMLKQIEQ